MYFLHDSCHPIEKSLGGVLGGFSRIARGICHKTQLSGGVLVDPASIALPL